MRQLKNIGICVIGLIISCTAHSQIELYPIEVENHGEVLGGYINKEGKVMIKPMYGRVYPFNENGLAIVAQNSRFGIINAKNEFVLEPKYTNIKWVETEQDYFIQESADKKHWWKSDDKRKPINPLFGGDESIITGNYPFSLNDKRGFFNRNGQLIIPADYDRVGYASWFENGYVVLKKEKTYYVFDSSGTAVLETKHEITHWNGQGLIPFRDPKTRNKGFLNLQGQVIVPAEYKSVGNFENGYSHVYAQNNEKIRIDTNGTQLSEEAYLAAQTTNFVIVEDPKTRKDGLKSPTGKVLIPSKYNDIKPQANGMFLCTYQKSSNDYNELHLFNKDYKLVKVVRNLWYSDRFNGDLVRFYAYVSSDGASKVMETYMNEAGKIVWQGEPQEPACFPKESLISMADGTHKLISEVAEGDMILSYDDMTGLIIESRVERVDCHYGNFAISEIQLGNNQDLLVFEGLCETSGTRVSSTRYHPFYALDGGMPMEMIHLGEEMIFLNEKSITESQKVVMKSDNLRTVSSVYNLKVASGNYFVNRVLVLVK